MKWLDNADWRVPDQTVLEIGYLFQREFWHNGFATEAAKACKQYAFEQLNAQRVYSIIRDTNAASQKVAERSRMVRCGDSSKHYHESTCHIICIESQKSKSQIIAAFYLLTIIYDYLSAMLNRIKMKVVVR